MVVVMERAVRACVEAPSLPEAEETGLSLSLVLDIDL